MYMTVWESEWSGSADPLMQKFVGCLSCVIKRGERYRRASWKNWGDNRGGLIWRSVSSPVNVGQWGKKKDVTALCTLSFCSFPRAIQPERGSARKRERRKKGGEGGAQQGVWANRGRKGAGEHNGRWKNIRKKEEKTGKKEKERIG